MRSRLGTIEECSIGRDGTWRCDATRMSYHRPYEPVKSTIRCVVLVCWLQWVVCASDPGSRIVSTKTREMVVAVEWYASMSAVPFSGVFRGMMYYFVVCECLEYRHHVYFNQSDAGLFSFDHTVRAPPPPIY